ncbi:3'-5' exonuclease [Halomonas sp. hl-4]|uniref:3'-5' exonuclease n=1 Tax=Halomonas sp. hl-4 TaxID=1761789 RepID=UPI000BB76CEE|nr:3'-5' exonuclease [Halomonas sp. hl-4]SNY95523.1 DNA polymerase-3 subunit epsilon [Halomonas sp. hl-4]
MTPVLFFDTETTGLPDWKSPSDSEHQPHLVQIAAILADANTRQEIATMDLIIKPDGWAIPDEVAEIHGITTEKALAVGVPEQQALSTFLALHDRCTLRVAHNTTFDNRIIRIAMKRFAPDAIPEEEWKDRERYYCTLINARKQFGGKDGHALGELYERLTGKTLEDAHSAMADARACMEVYWHLLDHEAKAA